MQDSPKPPEGDEDQPARIEQFHTYIGALLILTSIFFVNFMARIVSSPLMPRIETDLGLTHAHAGSFFLLISLGYFLTLLSSGFFSARLTHRQTILLSGVTLGLALLGTAFGNGLWGIRLGLLTVGMAAGLYLPSGIATITSSIGQRHWGKAIAIHELAPNLSFVAAPLLSEAVMLWFPWQAVFLLLGITALVLTGVFARFGHGGEFRGEAPSYGSFRKILSKPAFWIMVILFSLGISGALGIYTMLPLYLVTAHGIERHTANTLVAFSRIAGLGMTLVGGWATDRFGAKRVLKLVFTLTGLTTIFIGLASTSWVSISVFLQPMLAGCFFPAGLAALSLVTSDMERNIVVSLTLPIAFLIGGGAIPTLIGFIGDVGTFALGFTLVGGLIFSGALFSSCLR